MQALVPEQAPFHPVKLDPFAGIALRVTVVPWAYVAEQAVEQFVIPDGELLTLPLPRPEIVT